MILRLCFPSATSCHSSGSSSEKRLGNFRRATKMFKPVHWKAFQKYGCNNVLSFSTVEKILREVLNGKNDKNDTEEVVEDENSGSAPPPIVFPPTV